MYFGAAFYLYNMKKIVFALLCLMTAKIASAQKELLVLNEQNKYIYYKVVDQAVYPADTLQARAAHLIKIYPRFKVTADKSPDVAGTGSYLVMNTMAIVKHIDGEVKFTINVECKDQKYRYWLTDFVFLPYKVDRFGNPVAQPGIEIPLEKAQDKLTKKQTQDVLYQTAVFCKQFGDKLEQRVKNQPAPKAEKEVKKVVTDKW